MSDQEISPQISQRPKAEEIIDLTTATTTDDIPATIHDDQWPLAETDVCEVRSQHIKNGHTFVVTTVRTETTTMTSSKTSTEDNLRAIPLMNTDVKEIKEFIPQAKRTAVSDNEQPCSSTSINNCSSAEQDHATKAIVPLSSSLPSKLLRFHAKRSAQALLNQVDSQNQSLDSQFGSDEGMQAGCSSGEDDSCHESLEASAPPLTPPPPRNSPSENGDEKIDVGMGSSIEGSEESEEDDELKPLAVDNHVLHDVDLGSSPIENSCVTDVTTSTTTITTAVLSEANLEKFRKNQPLHHLHMDNIYLHPNFKYEPTPNEANPVGPSTAGVEQKRVHRSFLTMKKSSSGDKPEFAAAEVANSVVSQATTVSVDKPLINEVDTLDPSLIPSDELAEEITEAVEYYFSNESILKDAFLLKHVKRNKEGFVSLKLVSSFKRVRQLTKEWKVVGNAVRRKSHKIELNDIGTKVRRIEPLPSFDETMPSRTIVVCDLPLDKLSIEKVSDIFSKCGEIALIRILKPGMAIPVDVRQFMNKYPEMQQKECALVEYLESASARDAHNLQGPFKVYEMVAPKKKTGKKAVIQVTTPVVRMVENYRYFNDHNYERTRGGSFSGAAVAHDFDLRYRLKRNNSDFNAKTYPTEVPSPYVNSGPSGHVPYHHAHVPQQYNGAHRGSFASDHQHSQTGSVAQHHQNHQHHNHYQPRGSVSQESTGPQSPVSPGGNNQSYFAYNPRRYSNTSTISASTANMNNIETSANKPLHPHGTLVNSSSGSNLQRRLSNCSQEGGVGYADMVRRTSNCSDNAPQRRDSNCSDNCPCSRRVSDYSQTNEVYRKSSLGSVGSNNERRFSNGSMQFERTFSNASDLNSSNNHINHNNNSYNRRMSNDFNLDRKQSLDTQPGTPFEDPNVGGGGGGYNVFPRRYSNNFNNISSKLAQYDNSQYINGRRISTDSGYDRRCSFGSEYEGSPRSRTGSFLNNYKHGSSDLYDGQPRSRTGSFIDNSPRSRSGSFATRAAEHLVRTPMGPDGSKGFGFRARKLEHTIGPV